MFAANIYKQRRNTLVQKIKVDFSFSPETPKFLTIILQTHTHLGKTAIFFIFSDYRNPI